MVSVAMMMLMLVESVPDGRGQFIQTLWGPVKGNSFRVNSPDTAQGRFADRPEAQQTGLLTLGIDEDLSTVLAAELYLELWGGHPGVAGKRFTLNGRREYTLPEVGASDHNCTYSYPAISLQLADLTPGDNAFQFACDKGSTFWGHYLMREAAVRLLLPDDHAKVRQAGLEGMRIVVRAEPAADGAGLKLALDIPEALAGKVAAVAYWARYQGYDENGNGRTYDWHGFTKDRVPVAVAAMTDKAPFEATWDTSMLLDQHSVAVRAVVAFKDVEDLAYQTPAVTVKLPDRESNVALYAVTKMHRPFWSRADRVKKATIALPCEPADIERAQLHVLIWDGGAGGVEDHFTINGHAIKIAGKGHHDLLYRVLDVDPAILRRGDNEIRLLSATEHHGIEVILPGPALIVRTRSE